jgi:nucleotide-binding universal stress UspA family protein
MNIKSILFPTDFSHCNDAALKYASALAAEANATLHIVYVHDVRDLNAAAGEPSYVYASAWEDERRNASQRLKKVVPAAATVTYSHHCLTGAPVTEIVAFAEENKIDLIVMASHGRTGVSRLLMGSVAEGVMRKAPCPVLIVRQPAEKDAPDKNLFTPSQETRLLT